jgi:hypothetical protein
MEEVTKSSHEELSYWLNSTFSRGNKEAKLGDNRLNRMLYECSMLKMTTMEYRSKLQTNKLDDNFFVPT